LESPLNKPGTLISILFSSKWISAGKTLFPSESLDAVNFIFMI
jgi:hypothetical protein